MDLGLLKRLGRKEATPDRREVAGRTPVRGTGLDPDMLRLMKRLGRRFGAPALLREALTHSTYANEHPGDGPANERLEFLGDAVIDLLVAELLFSAFAADAEGALTARRARVVRWETLADLATELGLASALRLGQGESRTPAGDRRRILADAYEALVGAVFLDGGYAAVRQCFGEEMTKAIRRTNLPVDFKTLAQEACHRAGLPTPVYRVAAVEGPDHARQYTCELLVGDEILGRGRGSSKKVAEQQSAQEALGRLEAR
jgi:ribonuclease-3